MTSDNVHILRETVKSKSKKLHQTAEFCFMGGLNMPFLIILAQEALEQNNPYNKPSLFH